jgi:PhnB protein
MVESYFNSSVEVNLPNASQRPPCRGDVPVASAGFEVAELAFGDSVLMIGDELPDGRDPSPQTLGGSTVALYLYVEDVDGVFAKALQAEASSVQEPEDHFYGDRVAMFDDPFGHRWNITTHIENVPPEEMERRAAEAMQTA